MRQDLVHIEFGPGVEMPEVEGTLRLARLAAESLHGADRVELEVGARVDVPRRACVVDATSEAGRTLALVFLGFVRREFGPGAVRVTRSCRLKGTPPTPRRAKAVLTAARGAGRRP